MRLVPGEGVVRLARRRDLHPAPLPDQEIPPVREEDLREVGRGPVDQVRRDLVAHQERVPQERRPVPLGGVPLQKELPGPRASPRVRAKLPDPVPDQGVEHPPHPLEGGVDRLDLRDHVVELLDGDVAAVGLPEVDGLDPGGVRDPQGLSRGPRPAQGREVDQARKRRGEVFAHELLAVAAHPEEAVGQDRPRGRLVGPQVDLSERRIALGDRRPFPDPEPLAGPGLPGDLHRAPGEPFEHPRPQLPDDGLGALQLDQLVHELRRHQEPAQGVPIRGEVLALRRFPADVHLERGELRVLLRDRHDQAHEAEPALLRRGLLDPWQGRALPRPVLDLPDPDVEGAHLPLHRREVLPEPAHVVADPRHQFQHLRFAVHRCPPFCVTSSPWIPARMSRSSS